MTDRGFSWLSLPVVTVLLAALALGLVYLGRVWGLGIDALFLLAVPVAIAVAYLAWYRTLPYEPPWPTQAPGTVILPAESEPFEDPVEEADELERGAAASHDQEEPDDEEAEEPDESPRTTNP